MGELKNLAKQPLNLVDQARNAAQKVYLANVGAYSKIEVQARTQFAKAIETGKALRGNDAPKPVLVAAGFFEIAKDEVSQLNAATVQEQAKALTQRVRGLRVEDGIKLFDELVAEGEKRITL